jgi:hypothetical protein
MNNSFSMVAHKSSSDGLAYFDGVEATLFCSSDFRGPARPENIFAFADSAFVAPLRKVTPSQG